MFENFGLRVFRLAESRGSGGIFCDAEGPFVGPVPLLKRTRANRGAQERWLVRPAAELNEKLTLLYDTPIDVGSKIGGMETIARALNDGKLVLAKIATVQLRFPDPPPRPITNESMADKLSRATELYWTALLKAGDWDPDEHPRAGTGPNRGWFAEKPKVPNLPAKRGWPLRSVNQKAREWIAKAAAEIVPKAGKLILYGVPVVDAVTAFAEAFKPTELNGGENRLVAQMRTSFDPPKTLEELQKTPTENFLGYERHHIVERTPANIEKVIELMGGWLEKFGREKIEDPSNIAWVPRLRHEQISADYSRNSAGEGTPTVRENLSRSDFATQRAAGLEALKKYGVLK